MTIQGENIKSIIFKVIAIKTKYGIYKTKSFVLFGSLSFYHLSIFYHINSISEAIVFVRNPDLKRIIYFEHIILCPNQFL